MKIKEVVQSKRDALKESIEKVNDTGVSADELVKIAETQEKAEWTAHTTIEDFLKHLEELEK